MFSLQIMLGGKDKSFELLRASADAALEAAKAVDRLARDGASATSMATFAAVRKREKELANEISEELINTFVTALDREDIEEMNAALYKIPKTVEKFAERYALVADRLDGVDFGLRTEILVACTETVAKMVAELKHSLRIGPIRKWQDRLQALEAEADKLLLEPYSDFYVNATDPIQAMLTKDLLELLERAIDRCRDVGNVIYFIVLKNS
ncbi:MAG: pit accessory protein [Gammaproteobacteria bacterium]|nr:pit accessory protein [Gammaproteobacteria bacterium]